MSAGAPYSEVLYIRMSRLHEIYNMILHKETWWGMFVTRVRFQCLYSFF